MAVFDGDCWDGPKGCEGETFLRQTLSGSGDVYSGGDRHYGLYVDKLQPVMDDINRRYIRRWHRPISTPYYAGESWDDDGW